MRISRKKQALLAEINQTLFSKYSTCPCPLNYETPFQLLVAVELSAQCTDIRVNLITHELFKKYPDIESLADASLEDVENLIRPGGLFRNKAKNIISAAQSLRDDPAGKVPQTMRELTQLAGIGRKSANVILGVAFNIPGFPVDTHVKRVLKRLGITNSDNPEKIEAEVNALIPDKYWTNLSHMLILHGRETCAARKPDCAKCIINNLCKYYKKG
ncbi:MAG: endonuclease III [Victivallaceae bacterium]|nr:endonuclease III [Victivallaceae bacterium]